MIKYAICEGILSGDPFVGYVPLRPKLQQKYLTRTELEKIMYTSLGHSNGYLVRDMFLFIYFTRLAYWDMINFIEEEIIRDESRFMD